MMLFQRRVFVELLRNALLSGLGLLVVLLLATTVTVVNQSDVLSLPMFVKALPIFAATNLDMVIPVSVLVSVVITYGRVNADNEVDTLRACGVHPAEWMTPGVLFGTLMALVLLVVVDNAQPLAGRAQRRLSKQIDLPTLLEQRLSVGEPVELSDKYTIAADEVGVDGRPRKVRIQVFAPEGDLESEIIAEAADLSVNEGAAEFVVDLHDWRETIGSGANGRAMTVTIPLPRDLADLKIEHMTTSQLRAWLGRPEERRFSYREPAVLGEVHLRLATAVTCILFTLLGMPVALTSKRHDKVHSFLVAFLLALFVYYPSLKVSKALFEVDGVSPVIASWSGTTIMGVIGVFLCLRVMRR